MGDEGGFSPPMKSPEEAIEAIIASTEELGYSEKVTLAMDVAANSFFVGEGVYNYRGDKISTGELIEVYVGLVEKYLGGLNMH